MVYRVTGGVGLLLLGLSTAGFLSVGSGLIGIVLIIAGIALLAGV